MNFLLYLGLSGLVLCGVCEGMYELWALWFDSKHTTISDIVERWTTIHKPWSVLLIEAIWIGLSFLALHFLGVSL